jgi:hypothetical protein
VAVGAGAASGGASVLLISWVELMGFVWWIQLNLMGNNVIFGGIEWELMGFKSGVLGIKYD